MKLSVCLLLALQLSALQGVRAAGDNENLAALNDRFLQAIREHRTQDALTLRRQGATATYRAFMKACAAGDLHVVKALVLGGLEVRGNVTGAYGLIEAMQHPHNSVCRYLLTQGVDPNHPLVLTKALLYGDLETVQLCVAAGGRLRDPEAPWGEPLFVAASNTRYGGPISLWLLEQGVDAVRADRDGGTPLHGAVIADPSHSNDVIAALLKRGANPNAQDREGVTPLMLASRWGNSQRVRLLLAYGADPSVQDAVGSTCGHWMIHEWGTDLEAKEGPHRKSITRECETLLRILCKDRRFNPFAKDEEGHTPRDIAVKYRLEKAQAMLADCERRWEKRQKRGAI